MAVPYDKTAKYQLLEEVGFKKHFSAKDWPEYNRQFFDGLAPKYDALNQVLSLCQHQRFKKKAIRNIKIKPGARILDICTGSGDMAISIAKRYPSSWVTGVDVSIPMLELAAKRSKGLPNIEFRRADALELPFRDQHFDVSLISFGLRNLDDLKLGLTEMKRVTKAGGQVVNLDLGLPENPVLKTIHEFYFRKFVPLLGRFIFHRHEFNSFHYLPASGKYFPSQRQLMEIFSEIGFVPIEKYDFMLGAVSQQIATVALKD